MEGKHPRVILIVSKAGKKVAHLRGVAAWFVGSEGQGAVGTTFLPRVWPVRSAVLWTIETCHWWLSPSSWWQRSLQFILIYYLWIHQIFCISNKLPSFTGRWFLWPRSDTCFPVGWSLRVFSRQALDGDFSEDNRNKCRIATAPLIEAVENLTAFASNPEFVSVPAQISTEVRNLCSKVNIGWFCVALNDHELLGTPEALSVCRALLLLPMLIDTQSSWNSASAHLWRRSALALYWEQSLSIGLRLILGIQGGLKKTHNLVI